MANKHVLEFELFAEEFNRRADEFLVPRSLEEERRSRTLKPTVVVGLGGTGCEIGARLKRTLQWYYSQLGEAVQMVQFVMLDTQPLEEQASDIVKQTFVEGGDYHFLGGFAPDEYIQARLPRENDLRRWWDTNYRTTELLFSGCKRIRQLGRLCLYRSRREVATVLTDAIGQAGALDREATQSLRLAPLPVGADVGFYILTGSCGGTGSGMFLDVCHLLYRAAKQQGIATPPIRALIVMPTLYVDIGRHVWGQLAEAFQANAYAFFREVHHFILNGDEWASNHCMDAEERKERGEEVLGEWKPATRFYLIDNRLAGGRVLTKLDDVYTLAADALFHIIATPVGIPEEGQTTVNVDGALSQLLDGRATAFSSLGVSYVIYPAKTIARCAAAGYLRGLIYERYTRSLTDDDRQQAAQRAKELFENHASFLNAANVAQTLRSQADSLVRGISTTANMKKSAEERRGRGRLGFYGAMEEATSAVEGLINQGGRLVEEFYQTNHARWLQEVDDLIRAELNTCSGTDCLSFAQQVFRELKRLVSETEPPSAGSPSTSEEESCKREVQRLERDWIPNSLQRRALNNQLRNFASALRRRYTSAITLKVANLAQTYRGEVVDRLEEAIARCDQAWHNLRLVGDALDDQADEYDPESDERYLVATTQLVPGGGVQTAVQDLHNVLRSNLADDALTLINQMGQQEVMWALSAEDEEARQTVVEILVDWAIQQRALKDALQKPVHEVGIQDVGGEDFTNRVLVNLLRLSDPTWELDLTRAAMEPGSTITLTSLASPAGLTTNLLPTELAQQAQGATKPMDQRRIVILRSEHAAPLHAVVGMDTLRGAYRTWIKSKDRRGEPVHISREWNRGLKLVDLFPRITGVSSDVIRYFALGNFTDWLVEKKEHKEAQQVVTGWDQHGYLYRRGPNRFYALLIEKVGDELRPQAQKEKSLNPEGKGGRAVAMENFDGECIRSARLYIERLEQLIAWEELKELLREYVEVLQEGIGKATTPEYADQLVTEQAAIKEYLRSAEEA